MTCLRLHSLQARGRATPLQHQMAHLLRPGAGPPTPSQSPPPLRLLLQLLLLLLLLLLLRLDLRTPGQKVLPPRAQRSRQLRGASNEPNPYLLTHGRSRRARWRPAPSLLFTSRHRLCLRRRPWRRLHKHRYHRPTHPRQRRRKRRRHLHPRPPPQPRPLWNARSRQCPRRPQTPPAPGRSASRPPSPQKLPL